MCCAVRCPNTQPPTFQHIHSSLTITSLTLSYLTLSYLTLSYLTLSSLTLSSLTLASLSLSSLTLSYITFSFSYPLLSYPLISYPILSYPLLSYRLSPLLSSPLLHSPLLISYILSLSLSLASIVRKIGFGCSACETCNCFAANEYVPSLCTCNVSFYISFLIVSIRVSPSQLVRQLYEAIVISKLSDAIFLLKLHYRN